MHAHEPQSVVVHEPLSKAARTAAAAAMLLGLAAFIVAVAVLVYILWLIFASVTATGFDADGVRCYHRALQIACIKTANP
jgi:hypothetical protein